METIRQGLEDVAAAIRTEIRLEAEEAEREAAIAAAMRRNVADVAIELMAHGDTVALDVGGRILVGRITGVGAELLTLDANPWRVDANLASLTRLRVLKRARAGGLRGAPELSVSLRARLLELQLSRRPVEVGMVGTDEPVVGPVALVGADHVAIGEEARPEWFLPFSALAFLRVREPEE